VVVGTKKRLSEIFAKFRCTWFFSRVVSKSSMTLFFRVNSCVMIVRPEQGLLPQQCMYHVLFGTFLQSDSALIGNCVHCLYF